MPDAPPQTASFSEVLTRIFEGLPMAIAVLDASGFVLGANEAFSAIVGRPADALRGTRLNDIAPMLGPTVLAAVGNALSTREAIEEFALAFETSGRRTTRSVSCYPMHETCDNATLLVIAEPDVASTVPIQDALRRAETRYQLATHVTADAVYDWHVQSGEIHWNENLATLFAHDLSTVEPDLSWWEHQVHPEDRARVIAELDATLVARSRHWTSEYRFRRGDGTYAVVLDRGSVLFDATGQPTHMIGAMQDLTEIRRAQADLELLARVSERLARVRDIDATLRDLADVLVPAMADWAIVDRVGEGGVLRRVAVAARSEADEALGFEINARFPSSLTDPRGIGSVLRSGRAELFPTVEPSQIEAVAKSGEHLALLLATRIRYGLAVPLVARGEVIGGLTLATTSEDRPLDERDLHLAEDVARRCTLALDNAILFGEATAAAERMARLQAVTAGLSRAVTPSEVAMALVDDATAQLGARWASVHVFDGGDPKVLAARATPCDASCACAWDVTAGALAREVLRSGRAVWPAPPGLRASGPSGPSRCQGTLAGVPLPLGGRARGVLVLGFARPHAFEAAERDLLATLGQVAAQALERAQLFEARSLAEERLRLALAAADIGTWDYDVASGVVTVDTRSAELLGPRPEARTTTRDAIFARVLAEDRASFQAVEAALRGSSPHALHWRGRVRMSDGSVRWVDVRSRTLAAEGDTDLPTRILGTVIDVTETKRAEDERERLVGELREAVAVRDQFISLASHELKTPLTSTDLQLQSLMRATREGGPPLRRELLRDLAESAWLNLGRLNELIDRLLDVTRLTVGPPLLIPRDLDVRELASEVVGRLRPEAQEVGTPIEIHCEGDLRGHFDRMRLDQILSNLLSNALRYAPGEPIAVRVAREGGQLVLEVKDRGIGIAPEDMQRIFHRFERAVPHDRYAGLGVGLWIVAEIVRAMGGRIEVDSAPGVGATFTVRLPFIPAGGQEARA